MSHYLLSQMFWRTAFRLIRTHALHSKAAGENNGKAGGFALVPQTMLLRQQTGNKISSGLSDRRGNILEEGPRSDFAIIHPSGRGVCRRQAKKRVASGLFLTSPRRREGARSYYLLFVRISARLASLS